MTAADVQAIADRVLARRVKPADRPVLALALRAAAAELVQAAAELEAGELRAMPRSPLARAAVEKGIAFLIARVTP